MLTEARAEAGVDVRLRDVDRVVQDVRGGGGGLHRHDLALVEGGGVAAGGGGWGVVVRRPAQLRAGAVLRPAPRPGLLGLGLDAGRGCGPAARPHARPRARVAGVAALVLGAGALHVLLQVAVQVSVICENKQVRVISGKLWFTTIISFSVIFMELGDGTVWIDVSGESER